MPGAQTSFPHTTTPPAGEVPQQGGHTGKSWQADAAAEVPNGGSDAVTRDLAEGGEGESASAVEVRRFEAADVARWDDFVRDGCAEATFFHLSGWEQVLTRAFGHRCHYLLAERAGKVVGVLPLAQVQSVLFGHALISTPFCVYGGVAATDESARTALTEAACRLAESLKVDYLELRNRRRANPDWPAKDLYVTFRRELAADEDTNLKAIPRKQRAMVRKGIKAGLHARADNNLDWLYSCYAESVRNLGTPVFSRRYLDELQRVFGEQCETLTVLDGDAPVASVLSFYFRDEVLPYYGGGKASARRVAANDFMYWSVMQRAVSRGGISLFDYGRSKVGTGSYDFKRHWGFEPEPLHYEYFLVQAKAMPNLSPMNPKYRLFIAAWKRLPNVVARTLGPWLAKSLG
jgi:FemAB-related protein (PEP-CTERM system-associated)